MPGSDSRFVVVARPIAGVIVGLLAGGVFDYLYVNAAWGPNATRVMFAVHAALGAVLVVVAVWRIRLHGAGFSEGALLGVAASIAICWALLLWVVVGAV
jgi:hypothetical protein